MPDNVIRKKCTGKKNWLALALHVFTIRYQKLPRSAILLDPTAEKALSPADDPGKKELSYSIALGKKLERVFPELAKLKP